MTPKCPRCGEPLEEHGDSVTEYCLEVAFKRIAALEKLADYETERRTGGDW